MKGSSLVLTISLASILSVALLSAVPNEALAQEEQFDYRCYNTDRVQPDKNTAAPTLIKLTDQFGTQVHQFGPTLEYCNPAVKVEPNMDSTVLPNDVPHFRCWAIDNTGSIEIDVDILDQFFPNVHEHTVGIPVEFCHTVFKDAGVLNIDGTPSTDPALPYPGDTGDQIEGIIANWKCYQITGDEPLDPTRRLHDQFTRAANEPDGTVLDPRFPLDIYVDEPLILCAPAIKNYAGPDFPSEADEPSEILTHLICYDILEPDQTPTEPFPPGHIVGLSDQFTDNDNTILQLDKLCTDAQKTLKIAGTFIPLNSVAILLAGAQMSAAWILPALVAVTGVAYGIDIARKYHKDIK